ncbi:MAG: penicillin-binding protein [Lachnospiraceae bacterium]|nr:penicillin-binding protein [Lachnospiraceae bacterium]
MFDGLRERIINIFTSRVTIIYLIMTVLCGILLYRCFVLQIINGQSYLDNFMLEQEKVRDIMPTRGNIYDRNGNILAYNELAYSVNIEDTFETSSSKDKKLNELVYNLIKLIEKNGDTIDSDFKITLNEDGEFVYTVSGTYLNRFLADVYDHADPKDLTEEEKASTPVQVIIYLSRKSGKGFHFAVGDYLDPEDTKSEFIEGKGYTNKEWLEIVEIRYAMSLTSYRKYIGTTISTDVKPETVALIMENSDILPGVTIQEDTVRRYVNSVYFAHILGYTGRISAEEIDALNQRMIDEGATEGTYTSVDVVGKSGIENYLETTLQGTKGYEKVMVDNTGKVLSVLEHKDAVRGQDVYLSIDMDLTMELYDITERKLAYIIVQKLQNAKFAVRTTDSVKTIPIADVYYAVFRNNVLDIDHFASEEALPTERDVYERYLSYKDTVYSTLEIGMRTTRTPYEKLSDEYKIYQYYIVKLLMNNGVIMTSEVDSEDSIYKEWENGGNVSLGDFLDHAIALGWVDISKLDLESKYADSSEIFDALVVTIFKLCDADADYQTRFYKYMILNDKITGYQVCKLLIEQEAINIPESEINRLNSGAISSYTFMVNRISNLDITPAQLALEPCNGSVVMTNPNNGQVLALVSYPGYDNNKMANTVDNDYYNSLLNDDSSPLLNFATQYKSAPGSTFKIVSATVGFNEGIINTSTLINCSGIFTDIEPPPKCTAIHGNETVRTAIRDSCNIYFFNVGYRLATLNGYYDDAAGLQYLAQYADLYGLSQKSGVEITEYEPDISDLDSVRSYIGQGTNAFTTTQLARYVSSIANGGTTYDLTLLDHIEDSYGRTVWEHEPVVYNNVYLEDYQWNSIVGGMIDAVDKKPYFADIPVVVAGKTGTAQQSRSKPDHSLFICFAPAVGEPEVALSVRIPFGFYSDYAAQLAHECLQAYYGIEPGSQQHQYETDERRD